MVKIKILIIYSLFTLVSSTHYCFSQPNGSFHYSQELTIKRKSLVFVAQDSIYKLTFNIDDFGNFNFNIGKTNIIDNGTTLFIQMRKNKRVSYILKTIDIEGTDTIVTYNPLHSESYTDVKNIINKGVNNHYSQLIDDVRFSYLYKKLGVDKISEEKNPTLRILIPMDFVQSSLEHIADIKPNIIYTMTSERIYCLYEIKFLEKTATFYKTIGFSNDAEGFKMMKKDSAILKNRDLNHLMKIITTSLTSDVDCRRPLEPSLLEYWNGSVYKQLIITDECLRTNKSYKKGAKTYYFVMDLRFKYFR